MPYALTLALGVIATLTIAVPAWVVTHPPRIPTHHLPPALAKLRQRVVAPTELPPVEPTSFVDLAPEDAREYNAGVPFSTGPNPAARPFRFAGGTEERARATDCLAAAVIYEAGDDAPGERAVAQVVLNRLRHPAFPKTVCGVVFEGSERSTGCQFTFTCDGALTRWHPSDAGWRRAREVAAAALSGGVYKPVGYATHYHTDWVVPYWQSSLDKIAAVRTHLFFRWSGWWGTPPAFNRTASADEPVEQQLAALSDAHRSGSAMEEVRQTLAEALVLQAGEAPAAPGAAPADPQAGSFLVTLDPRLLAEDFIGLAMKTCGERPRCSFMGWDRAALTPKALPLTADQIATMSFSYLRDRAGGFEKALWNCAEFKRADRSQCMKQQVLLTASPPPAPTPVATRGPEELTGIRRVPMPAATATPLPQPSPRTRPGAQGVAAPRS